MFEQISKMSLITISKVSQNHNIMASVTKRVLDDLEKNGKIKPGYRKGAFRLYTRAE